MTQIRALTIDWRRCTGCGVCELACSFTHEGFFNPTLSRIRVVRLDERGAHFPVACLDCASPPCVEACPTAACHIDSDVPVVRVDADRCIGCRECVLACPFGAAHFNSEKGVAYQCDLCDGDPECVTHCHPGALTFEPTDAAAKRKGRDRAVLRVETALRDQRGALS